MRVIDFYPAQVLRKGEAIRSSVHSGCDIDDGIDAERDGFLNESIDGDGANGQRERHRFGVGNGFEDVLTAFAGKSCGEMIAKDCVRSRRFAGAKGCDPQRGVRNVGYHRRLERQKTNIEESRLCAVRCAKGPHPISAGLFDMGSRLCRSANYAGELTGFDG